MVNVVVMVAVMVAGVAVTMVANGALGGQLCRLKFD